MQGDFKVTDTYTAPEGRMGGSGITIVSYRGTAVWTMTYVGFYSKEVVPFLKEALVANYHRRTFLGGRGPQHYSRDSMIYTNRVQSGDFRNFSGEENIYRGTQCAGWYRYQGMYHPELPH